MQSSAATRTSPMLESGSVIYQAKFVDVNGIRTRYYDEGQGEVMLMIHGSRFSPWGSANTWTRNIPGLSKKFRVLAPDKLCAGMTDNPKSLDDFTQHAIVQHIYQFIQILGVKSFHVVGQSNGGYTAARLALEHPDMCKSLVIVDSATLGPPTGDMAERRHKLFANGPKDLREYIRFHWGKLSVNTDNITDDYLDAAVFMANTPKARETLRILNTDGREDEGVNPEANVRTFQRDKAETHQWIQEGRLTMPVLITWGANDPSAILPIGIKLFEMISAKTKKTEMHIFNNVAHFHYREIPEDWNQVVMNFIERNV
jgi:2-hydroxy-6-oxonona-2,4-dienedioate hydrolase